MAYTRKTRDEFEVESNHGYGWDVVTTEDTRTAGRAQLRCYRENEPQAAHRMVKRRVPLTGDPVSLGTCEWFAMCANEATHHEPHVILGPVPCCDRCSKIGA